MSNITIKAEANTELKDADDPNPFPMGIYEEV